MAHTMHLPPSSGHRRYNSTKDSVEDRFTRRAASSLTIGLPFSRNEPENHLQFLTIVLTVVAPSIDGGAGSCGLCEDNSSVHQTHSTSH